ncbi:hypothetical protein AC1031_019314 [Aphanomyces cochlioides]|nr:hypothetical protein AC1031_019314 [Aphanomyces cochlioides]
MLILLRRMDWRKMFDFQGMDYQTFLNGGILWKQTPKQTLSRQNCATNVRRADVDLVMGIADIQKWSVLASKLAAFLGHFINAALRKMAKRVNAAVKRWPLVSLDFRDVVEMLPRCFV